MGGGARVPDPAGSVSHAIAHSVKWEPPDAPDQELDIDLPAFVPGQQQRTEQAVPEVAGHQPLEPGAEPEWVFEPVGEPPPPAPTGQWWAAWLPDPRHRHEFRYWDGTTWTDHVSDAGLAGIDPL
jgi:Protein of unknown function (DUF2510)